MSEQLQPTSGRLWRQPREEGVAITLPSGHVARLRPVALDVMIAHGELPDLLTPLAAKTLWTEIEAKEIGDTAELATGTIELFNLVCRAAFVSPRVVDDPQADDEIGLADIAFEDKSAVFQLCIQGARALELFRERQAQRLEALHNGEGPGPAAQ